MDPSSEYCAHKQQGLKPPQETTCLFCSEIENKLPNKQTNKTNTKALKCILSLLLFNRNGSATFYTTKMIPRLSAL